MHEDIGIICEVDGSSSLSALEELFVGCKNAKDDRSGIYPYLAGRRKEGVPSTRPHVFWTVLDADDFRANTKERKFLEGSKVPILSKGPVNDS